MAASASRDRLTSGRSAVAAEDVRGDTTNLCCIRYLALGRSLGSCSTHAAKEVGVGSSAS